LYACDRALSASGMVLKKDEEVRLRYASWIRTLSHLYFPQTFGVNYPSKLLKKLSCSSIGDERGEATVVLSCILKRRIGLVLPSISVDGHPNVFNFDSCFGGEALLEVQSEVVRVSGKYVYILKLLPYV